MKPSEALNAMWRQRGAKHLDWFAKGYEAAVERLEDNTDDEDNPYWGASTEEDYVIPGERTVYDEVGCEEDPASTRQRAFELLVLADLAEVGTKEDA